MCDYSPFRERAMTVSEDKSWWCDPCIAPIVKALNDAGLRTVASCCGHRQRPGNIFLANGTELTIGQFVPSESKETPMTEYCDEPIEPLTDPGEDRRCGNPEPCPVHHPATRPPRPPACEKCDALWTPGHVCAPAARVVVDAAAPAASVPAADIPRERIACPNCGRVGWEWALNDPSGNRPSGVWALECPCGHKFSYPAAEQADKGEARTTCTHGNDIRFRCGDCEGWTDMGATPAAPPEMLCRCGHPTTSHSFGHGDCGWTGGVRSALCPCPKFTPPARVPVNDEAEAQTAAEVWHKWVLDEEPALPPGWWDITRRAVAAGFRAARQGGNGDE